MYFFSTKDSFSNVYSCDNLRVSFDMREDCLLNIKKHFENALRSDISMYSPCFSDFKYRYMFNIDYGRSTMTVGLMFNGSKKEDSLKGFLEVNPNKCFDSMMCQNDVLFLLSNCVGYSVTRWDLSIDIPVDREVVRMKKDQRKYELSQKSVVDRTEYLGQRSAPGRVKLYNKTIESGLDYPLTRLELTLGGGLDRWHSEFTRWCPTVWTSKSAHEDLGESELSDTQKVLVELLRESPDASQYLARVNFRVRKKIEPYVMGVDTQLTFDISSVKEIVTQLQNFFKRSTVLEWGIAQKGTRSDTVEEDKLWTDNPFV